MTTRQRLLDLGEKCPECKVKTIIGVHDYMKAEHMPNEVLEALARDAMAKYLTPDGWSLQINNNGPGGGFEVVIQQWHQGTSIRVSGQPTRTDALISAVEVVMENKDLREMEREGAGASQ